ncbi:MAG TPA: MOSC domain-containing protein [Candidatus Limnocylindrales bacterium]|nr:MOSC domain-containing protein [Candidatus Limnocylindrales bacterium]
MKLISVNIGSPRPITWKGKIVMTGIFKEPVRDRRILLQKYNLDGDRQADLSVHGGENKAVYVYPSEHYGFWQQQFPGMNLPWGMFGENFTTKGLWENEVHKGDRFRIGSAEVMVTQPRMPCYKLGVKFGRADIIRRFLTSGRTGFYLTVLQEGEVGAGDVIELIHRDESQVTIAEMVWLTRGRKK